MAGRGGRRPGAGRPKGSKTTKTSATAKRIAAAAKEAAAASPAADSPDVDSLLPLDVMVQYMRTLWAEGKHKEAAAIAKDCAPYLHAKLSSVQASIKHEADRAFVRALEAFADGVVASGLDDEPGSTAPLRH